MISTLWRMLQFPSRLLRLVLMTWAFSSLLLSSEWCGPGAASSVPDGAEASYV